MSDSPGIPNAAICWCIRRLTPECVPCSSCLQVPAVSQGGEGRWVRPPGIMALFTVLLECRIKRKPLRKRGGVINVNNEWQPPFFPRKKKIFLMYMQASTATLLQTAQIPF